MLNDIVFELIRTSTELRLATNSDAMPQVAEISDKITGLVFQLSEISSSITDDLDERNNRITASKDKAPTVVKLERIHVWATENEFKSADSDSCIGWNNCLIELRSWLDKIEGKNVTKVGEK